MNTRTILMFTVSVASLSSVTFAASGNVATTHQAASIVAQVATTNIPSSVATGLALQAAMTDNSGVLTLDQAIAAALETSPEINQAIMNKEAIEFEREQAQGLYLPRVDIEASAGIRRLENPTRRTLGIEDETLYPLEAGITAEQTLIDFGRRRGELTRQAARTDGAALRRRSTGERADQAADVDRLDCDGCFHAAIAANGHHADFGRSCCRSATEQPEG